MDTHGNSATRMWRRRSRAGQQPVVAVIGTRGYPSFYGGFETAVRKLAPDLADRGWLVRVYGRPGGRTNSHVVADERVQQVMTPGIQSKSLSTLSFGLTAVVHALFVKPDVALVMNVANGYWLPLLKWRGIRTVVNVDGIEWEREKWSRLGKFVFHWGARLTARFADELVFDAEAIGAYWRREFGRDGVFIPYGGDWVDDTTLDERLTDTPFVLLVARFVPENSVAAFLDAAPSIVELLDMDVLLVGSAPEGDPLLDLTRALVSENPRIQHLGHVSDDPLLFGLWKHARAYFHGHTVGGTNPALVQAMALGSRIVARDTVYNREVLGDVGHYCDDTRDSILQAVRNAVSDPRPLSDLARERARIHYSWALVCERYAELLSNQLSVPRN